MKLEDLVVTNLGPRTFLSPLELSTVKGDGRGDFVPDDSRILQEIQVRAGQPPQGDLSFEKTGPRQHIFFDPAKIKAAIVTCGGLCPGLNNVLRSTFLELHYRYRVPEVLGIRYGYQGLNPRHGEPPIRLTMELVDHIHNQGGTMLGSSRGPEEPGVMADFLQQHGINMLFCVGGDGTQRGAHQLALELCRRGEPIAVVGIPKTIDNDLPLVWRSFGYGTALEKAKEAINCAHVEARGAPNGIGLVKLMGRDAGFIAAGATLASQEVNFTLIPEVPVPLDGENGFLAALERRIRARRHAVIVVAEGAGQDLIPGQAKGVDASGNRKLQDIGVFLRDRIGESFRTAGIAINMKYIDPSYIIRSVPANSDDGLLCDRLSRQAVHAAMAGKTDVLIGLMHNTMIHVPIAVVTAEKKRMSPEGELWMAVLEATGQPHWGLP